MRILIYVPIIHTSADLGSIAKDVAKRGIADLGEEFWHRHEKTVEDFWDEINRYFEFIKVAGFKLYQDGMVAEGELGQKIIEEGIRLGSKNYKVLASLLQRGAVLVKLEDFKLVKLERDRLLGITQAKLSLEKLFGFIKYKLTKNILLNKRDRFIARRIAETLREGETAILFIGAYHDIKKRLPRDIQIKEIKDIEKVREYQRILPFYNKKEERFEELSRYLISKVQT